MSPKTVIIATLVLCFHSLGAQNYATRQLEYIAGLLKCAVPQQTDTFRCPKVKALPLVVEYDSNGTVNHLGIKLFSDSMKTHSLTKSLYDFQERLFLELLLQDNEDDARQLLQIYRVQYLDVVQGLDISFFSAIETSLRLTKNKDVEYRMTRDSLTWTSEWKTADGGNFVMRFPANYELISGMNREEFGRQFTEQLQNLRCEMPAYTPLSVNIEGMEQLRNTQFVLRGDNVFSIKDWNSNRYFEIRTVFDRKYPEESVANLFNAPDPQLSQDFDLQIKQTVSGGELQHYTIKLSDFQCFMGSDHNVFTGIGKIENGNVQFSVLYTSKYYNYWHLLLVETTYDTLFDKTAPLQATFFPFIPNQNIKKPNEYNQKNIKR